MEAADATLKAKLTQLRIAREKTGEMIETNNSERIARHRDALKIQDWVRFWNQFRERMDKTNIAPVTKFTYLKILLQPKVRALIDGLPFTTEGYERAKNILEGEYAETSEIVNGHVQNIMDLPIINGAQPAKVHEFYQALMFNVQSLETLGKLGLYIIENFPFHRLYREKQ